MKKILYFTVLLGTFLSIIACNEKNEKLPYLGRKAVVDGQEVPHTIRDFSFYNQDSNVVNNDVLSRHIYLADYFFTSCPSICPKVKKQMLRLYERYEDEPLVKLVSISMDTKRDSAPVLKKYANKLGVTGDRWWFLTGKKDDIFSLNEDFFIVAYEDNEVPGGFDHSGKIVMVDPEGRVRAFAEGTDPEDVTDMFKDIDNLIAEVKGNH